MTHYICTGECHGISNKPGNCQAKECSKHDRPLKKCSCTKKEHKK